MKIYTVVEANDETFLNIYTFKTRGDAEEFILSCAEEEALNWFNNVIAYAPVPSGVYVLHEWKERATIQHKSLEHYILSEGSVIFFNKIYESEVPD